jgi:hypothetical protein
MKNIPKVRQMSTPGDNITPNQMTIDTVDGVYFQSYKSVIAFRDKHTGKYTLDRHKWDYSVTTKRYLREFLNESVADTRLKIKSGEYKLADLNQ